MQDCPLEIDSFNIPQHLLTATGIGIPVAAYSLAPSDFQKWAMEQLQVVATVCLPRQRINKTKSMARLFSPDTEWASERIFRDAQQEWSAWLDNRKGISIFANTNK